MKKRKLGVLEVSAIGMGCMGFTHAYGETPSESDGIALVHKAFELGCNFFDTAEMYSYFKNEEFVGKALKELPRDKVIISDKFWPEKFEGHDFAEEKLSEAGIRKSLEGSLRRLQTDYIDLYTEHQMDDGTEEQVAFIMGKLIAEGKIRAWGQSSPTLDQIKKAHAVTPITAIQSEYSMMERKWERDVIPFCAANNIGFVAFSPMGNGFLSGKYSSKDEFKGNDVRRVITRFDPKNMDANQPLLDLINRFAADKEETPAQIALAWVLTGGDFIVPIPGMRKESRIRENLDAADVELTATEYAALTDELNKIKIYGTRSGKDIKKLGTVPDNVNK
ncbi:MAG: aldo/keto reductase [Selenomonadaceae bacterium]|nr:aldo/keto reductase [Selenomonadaceae bacterium]